MSPSLNSIAVEKPVHDRSTIYLASKAVESSPSAHRQLTEIRRAAVRVARLRGAADDPGHCATSAVRRGSEICATPFPLAAQTFFVGFHLRVFSHQHSLALQFASTARQRRRCRRSPRRQRRSFVTSGQISTPTSLNCRPFRRA